MLAARRKGFGTVREVAARLVERLKEHGGDAPIDIDGALQCESFDVIGRVGFRHDFRATADLSGPGAADCRTIKEGACSLYSQPHLILSVSCNTGSRGVSKGTKACDISQCSLAIGLAVETPELCLGSHPSAGCAIGVNDMRNPLRPVLRALPFLPEVTAPASRPMTHLLKLGLVSSAWPCATWLEAPSVTPGMMRAPCVART